MSGSIWSIAEASKQKQLHWLGGKKKAVKAVKAKHWPLAVWYRIFLFFFLIQLSCSQHITVFCWWCALLSLVFWHVRHSCGFCLYEWGFLYHFTLICGWDRHRYGEDEEVQNHHLSTAENLLYCVGTYLTCPSICYLPMKPEWDISVRFKIDQQQNSYTGCPHYVLARKKQFTLQTVHLGRGYQDAKCCISVS